MQDIEDEVIDYKVHLPSAPQKRDDLKVVSFLLFMGENTRPKKKLQAYKCLKIENSVSSSFK